MTLEYVSERSALDLVNRIVPDQISFTLPISPVPLSACFKNVARNGRADTPRYTAFKEAVDTYLTKHFRHLLGTPYRPTCATFVSVEYVMCRPDKRQRDLDNLLKSLNDTLTRNHILGDDSQIVDLRIRWKEPWVMDCPVHAVIQEAA